MVRFLHIYLLSTIKKGVPKGGGVRLNNIT